jgi:hypothetical protein
MLIKKPLAEGDVVSIKLITGEEIIARMDRDDHHGITVSKPLTVTLGASGLGMIPFMFLAENDSFTLKREHILVMGTAKKDAADQYLTGTTGIALQ